MFTLVTANALDAAIFSSKDSEVSNDGVEAQDHGNDAGHVPRVLGGPASIAGGPARGLLGVRTL